METLNKAPDRLYHYTSGDGLHGILKTASLRGTNFAFMNDRSEFTYGVELIRDCLAVKAKGLPDSGIRRALVLAHKVLEAPPCDVYLTCFCEEPDLLSQWRGYGTPDSRYCVELEVGELPRAAAVSPVSSVIYDSDLHRAMLSTMIDIYLMAMNDIAIEDEPAIRMAASSVAIAALPVVTRFKDQVFHEEKEWRCVSVTWGSDCADVEFASSGGGTMRPFKTLVHAVERLPIRRIIAGASRSERLAVRSAELMLRRFGYSDVPVEASKVPLQA